MGVSSEFGIRNSECRLLTSSSEILTARTRTGTVFYNHALQDPDERLIRDVAYRIRNLERHSVGESEQAGLPEIPNSEFRTPNSPIWGAR
jgi:hypothetical protein